MNVTIDYEAVNRQDVPIRTWWFNEYEVDIAIVTHTGVEADGLSRPAAARVFPRRSCAWAGNEGGNSRHLACCHERK